MSIPRKLHVGCGQYRIDGWINVDIQPYPGVDYLLDIRHRFPFADLEHIFAEHFIEHLAYTDAVKFLRNCRAALRDDGVLRLSTPNLDWVWATQYRAGADRPWEAQVRECFQINRGFYGWGHRFLYNFAALAETLRDAGFAEVASCEYGQSRHDALRGLERHEKSIDAPELPHVVIAEAWGRHAEGSGALTGAREDFLVAASTTRG